ncbi:MAG: flagellar M-ring protein FliF, partial [uncultured bacterium]
MDFLIHFKNQFVDFYKSVDSSTKLLTFLFGIVLVISIGVAVFLNRKPDLTLLFGDINEATSAQIVNILDDNNISYELKNNGRNIYVEKSQVNRVRLMAKAKGLPKEGDSIGFEIFDKTNLGVTDFVQNIQHHRALAGELERTIANIKGVEGVRVHIVLPEEKLFEEKKNETSATIMLTLTYDGALDSSQINSIRQLTASSVEGLKPRNVTIVDNYGNVLAAQIDEEETIGLVSNRMGVQKNLENYYSNKVQSLLDSVLGIHNSVVRVDALLDFNKIEETEEKFDPESAVVRSEVITSESASGATTEAKGPPGVQSNMSPGAKSGDSSNQENKSNREVINNKYEIDKKVRHIVKSVGDIQKLTVSVFLKKQPKLDDNSKPVKNEAGEPQFIERSAEELKVFTDIVRNAMGFNEERGDKIVIKEVAFDKKPVMEAALTKSGASDINSFIAPALKVVMLLGLM